MSELMITVEMKMKYQTGERGMRYEKYLQFVFKFKLN